MTTEETLCGGCMRPIEIGNESCDHKWQLPHTLLETEPCPSCLVQPGGLHHAGCEYATCPVCREQFNECPCEKTDPEMKFANVAFRLQLADADLLTGWGIAELARDMAEVYRDFAIRRRTAKLEYEYCRNRCGWLKRQLRLLVDDQ